MRYQKYKCPCCDELRYSVEKRRRNTAYSEDENNYLISCLYCYAEDFEDYGERWEDYYWSRM